MRTYCPHTSTDGTFFFEATPPGWEFRTVSRHRKGESGLARDANPIRGGDTEQVVETHPRDAVEIQTCSARGEVLWVLTGSVTFPPRIHLPEPAERRPS